MGADLSAYLDAASNGGLTHDQLLEVAGLGLADRSALTDQLRRGGLDDTAEALLRVYRAAAAVESHRNAVIVAAYADQATADAIVRLVAAEARSEAHRAPTNLPPQFWDARPELAAIRQAAWSETSAADAAAVAALARVAWLTPPSCVVQMPGLPDATLDLCVAMIGRTGAGKSSAADIARKLAPGDDDAGRIEVPMGSGEGIPEQYFGYVTEHEHDPATGKTTKVRVKRQTRRAGLFYVDEGAAFARMRDRKGSTLWETVKSGWSGQMLGQANASEDRTRVLMPRTYRFAMISGWQLRYATALLDDAAGGTPQRFLYGSAIDPLVPAVSPPWPAATPLLVPSPGLAAPLTVIPAIIDECRAGKLARATTADGDLDELDSHRDLLRVKVAALLCVLDGRRQVNGEDWALATMWVGTSDAVRQSIVTAAADLAAAEQAKTIGEAVAKTIATSAAVETDTERRALESAAKSVARHVHRAPCDGGCKRRCLANAIAGRHRKLIDADDAIAYAVAERWIRPDSDRFLPGQEVPT